MHLEQADSLVNLCNVRAVRLGKRYWLMVGDKVSAVTALTGPKTPC